jgi:hypothetical protein
MSIFKANMTKINKIRYPRYNNYVKSFYREGFDGFLPNIKDNPFDKLYPHICAWQFPDLDLIDYVYDHVYDLHQKDELSKGYCMHNGKIDEHISVKDSYDLSYNVDVGSHTHDAVDDFYLANRAIYAWINHCILDYCARNPLVSNCPLVIEHSNIQYQYYKPGGGFKLQHYERSMVVPNNFTSQQREFVFMIYLNNIKDGGTHFISKEVTLPAKKGLTVIFPAGSEYNHVSQISDTSEKMIITGWILSHPQWMN